MASKVVVGGAAPRVDLIAAGLEAAGCDVVMLPRPTPGTKSAVPPDLIQRHFPDADAFITSPREQYPRELLLAAKQLKLACSPVIGTDNIDLDTAAELGILVANGAVPENYEGVGEAIVMLTAALIKELPAKQAAVREGGWWPAKPGQLVARKTIGMIGFGRIGRATASRFAGWNCKLIAYDPYISPESVAEYNVQLVDLETLLRAADVISIQVVLTNETRHIIGERELSLMKPTAFLINTSRGDTVDDEALVRALNEGRLSGAAIDVWPLEPSPVDHPLRRHPRVIATGHHVGHAEEAFEALARAAVENVTRAIRGEEPLYIRNPEVLPAWRERLARLGVVPGR